MREREVAPGPGALSVVVTIATALVVAVSAVGAASMLLGADESASVADLPAATAATTAGDAADPGRTAADAAGAADAGGAADVLDLDETARAATAAVATSSCEDVAADVNSLRAATTAAGDASRWIAEGLLDVVVGTPLEELAVRCGSVHASAVLAAWELPTDVARPLAAYVTNGGARSDVDAAAALDELAAGVPASLLVGATATSSAAAFTLPSGNIGCVIGADGARCQVADASFASEGAPEDCDGRWAGELVVAAGQGEPRCLGAASLPGAGTVLGYGSSTRAHGFSCGVDVEGVACRNDATGHGFWLRSGSWRTF